MFRGYFDDSGTHTGGPVGASRLVVVGGIVISDDQHDKLAETWASILQRHGLPHFHLTKCKAGKKEPYASISDNDRKTLLDQLVRLMAVRIRMSCAAVVPIADYDAALTDEEKARYGGPYAWAAQWCWTIIRIWAERNGYTDPIPFVMEAGTAGEDQLTAAFNKAFADPQLKGLFHLHSLVQGDKAAFPGLQAADIIANSTYELGDHQFAGGRSPSEWAGIIARFVRSSGNHLPNSKFRHRQLIATAPLLRSETDKLNERYGKMGVIPIETAKGTGGST